MFEDRFSAPNALIANKELVNKVARELAKTFYEGSFERIDPYMRLATINKAVEVNWKKFIPRAEKVLNE